MIFYFCSLLVDSACFIFYFRFAIAVVFNSAFRPFPYSLRIVWRVIGDVINEQINELINIRRVPCHRFDVETVTCSDGHGQPLLKAIRTMMAHHLLHEVPQGLVIISNHGEIYL